MSSPEIFNVHIDRSIWKICGRRFLTASDCGTVIGLNPYKSPNALMAEKLGLKKREPAGPAMMWGLHHEDEARNALADELGVIIDAPCALYVRDGWLGAIPDGLLGNDALVEIKCRWAAATKGKRLAHIGAFDMAQVQIQLHVLGRELALFWQWTPKVSMLDRVEYDPDWIKKNLPALESFFSEWMDERNRLKGIDVERDLFGNVTTKETAK